VDVDRSVHYLFWEYLPGLADRTKKFYSLLSGV